MCRLWGSVANPGTVTFMEHGGSSSIGRASGCDPGDEEFKPPLSPEDLHWLAGLLEGEGSFLKPLPSEQLRPIVQVHMTDKDVMDHLARLLGTTVYQVKPNVTTKQHW